jgi:hypothetical protein
MTRGTDGANPSKLCPGWTPEGNKSGACTVTQNQTCTSAHTRAPDGSCHTCVLNGTYALQTDGSARLAICHMQLLLSCCTCLGHAMLTS